MMTTRCLAVCISKQQEILVSGETECQQKHAQDPELFFAAEKFEKTWRSNAAGQSNVIP
jgi:hypothetical protein